MLLTRLRIRPNRAIFPATRFLSTNTTIPLGSVVEAGDKTFDKVLSDAADTTVIVDFYADWCPPCKMLAPVLTKAVKENGKTFMVKVNVDESQGVAEKYEIASLPTVAAFKNAKIIDKFIGFLGEKETRAFVDRVSK
ncbi:thioredoxin-like protein [Chytridium lagenaria]|nr:thioredoxin-like protein [Chytridium lagenaria]